MPVALRQLCLVTCLALAAGCAQHTSHRADSSTVPIVPHGVRGFATAADAMRNGLYPGHDERSCCFISGDATIALLKPPSAKTATMILWVPDDVPAYRAHGVTLSIISAGVLLKRVTVKDQLQRVEFALPSSLMQTTVVPLEIQVRPTFVPEKLGINKDARVLGVVLVGFDYK